MRRILLSLIIIVCCFTLYGIYYNTKGLNIKEYNITSQNVPEHFSELKFVHFSDILYGSTTTIDSIDNLVNKINEVKPDVIFFTGDLFYKDYKPSSEELDQMTIKLKKLDANLYKYAISGENDEPFMAEYKNILEKAGFVFLDNSSSLLFYKDITPINIIGLNEISKLDELMQNDANSSYSIILTHEPDNFTTLKGKNVDLILAGHSLHGQVRLPFYGGLIKRNGAETYIDNHYKENNTEMFVTNGLGCIKYKIRLFNSPSFNVYRISK